LQFAVDTADAGGRARPPVAYPDELRPFLRQRRLPAAALGRVRRAVEAHSEYRARLAAMASPDAVDAIGLEWLVRADGWEERVAGLVDETALAAASEEAALALKRAERRREAAEEATGRARAEVTQLADTLVSLRAELADRQRESQKATETIAALRQDLATARRDARHALDRAEADRARGGAMERERDAALTRATQAEQQRDELLAARAELPSSRRAGRDVTELRALADAVSAIATRLGALVTVPTAKRQPVAVPGDVARDPARAAEHVLRAAGVLVLVDGYNVAKLTWPDLTLADQRRRLLDAVDTVARRFGAEVVVVFDGADVPGGHTRQRRMARVCYSPPGVIADDVIRGEVAAADPARPVVVVTNDAAVRRDAAAAGSNVIASETFAGLALGGSGSSP
jgi:hypothetical protein